MSFQSSHQTLLLIDFTCVFQRYLYYINNGIDMEHVAPLEDSWAQPRPAAHPQGTQECLQVQHSEAF